MRPFITLMTSTELQEALGNKLDDEDIAELKSFRDEVKEEFRQHLDTVSVMEELYGQEWQTRDLSAWFVSDDLDMYSISSPIIISEENVEDALFSLLQMLAENLIRQNYPESDLVENTYDKLDAVAALLARESLQDVMNEDRFKELMEEARSESEELKMWRAMDEYAEQWDKEEETLYEWLEDNG